VKYKGILAKPRLYSNIDNLPVPPRIREKYRAMEREDDAARLLELFRAHELTPYDWKGLAMALARTHVKGMKVEKAKRGAVLKWPPFSRFVLRFNVDQYAHDHDVPISRACEELAKREPYKSKLSRKASRKSGARGEVNPISARRREKALGKALRKQYDLTNSHWAKLLDIARSDAKLSPSQSVEAPKLGKRAKPTMPRKNR
jgi:hypothetical protein